MNRYSLLHNRFGIAPVTTPLILRQRATGSSLRYALTGIAVAFIWVVCVLASVFAPAMDISSQHEHVQVAASIDWLWAEIATVLVVRAAGVNPRSDPASPSLWVTFAICVLVVWLAVLMVSIFGPELVIVSDPIRLPLAAMISPLLGLLVTALTGMVVAAWSPGMTPAQSFRRLALDPLHSSYKDKVRPWLEHESKDVWGWREQWLIFPVVQTVYAIVLVWLWSKGKDRGLTSIIVLGMLTLIAGFLLIINRVDKKHGRFYNAAAAAGLIGGNTWAATGCAVSADPGRFAQDHLFDYIAIGAVVGTVNALVFEKVRWKRVLTLIALFVIAIGSAGFEVMGVDPRLFGLAAAGVLFGIVAGVGRRAEPVPHPYATD